MSALRQEQIIGIVAAVAAICLLMTEHLTHIPRLLIYGLILACPLMHLFGGHGHHHGHHHDHRENPPAGGADPGSRADATKPRS